MNVEKWEVNGVLVTYWPAFAGATLAQTLTHYFGNNLIELRAPPEHQPATRGVIQLPDGHTVVAQLTAIHARRRRPPRQARMHILEVLVRETRCALRWSDTRSV